MKTTINTYLTFDGNCEEAFLFYQSIFGGEFAHVGRFSAMPQMDGIQAIPEEHLNNIMHISLPISEETTLMGSDTGGNWSSKFKQGTNFLLSIQTKTTQEADRIFGILSVGAKITMPLQKTFWGSYFGSLTDKFGINWMMNVNLEDHE